MSNIKAIQKEKSQNFKDVYDNKIPKRVPVNITLPIEALCDLAGLDLFEAQWDPTLLESAVEKVKDMFYTDVCPGGRSIRFPSYYHPLKSQSFVMGSNGVFQHPEVAGMLADEYDYLIEKPLDCLYEKVLPRQYKGLNLQDPVNMMLNYTKTFLGFGNDFSACAVNMGRITEKYGYASIAPAGSAASTEAPFDFLADQLRGFKEISMDIRRMPEKVGEAVDALYPIVLKLGMPSVISNYNQVFLPLHMPTFMREKDFAKYWWPSFKDLLEEYASMGIHCKIFCEDNWDRYVDYLQELPTDTVLWFEYGDPKLIKEKLGNKHIITGLYPLQNLKNFSKQENIDKTKELIDILAPGGKYIFGFDKNPLSGSDIIVENLKAVTETVRDYGVYSNAGETAGLKFNKEDYKKANRRTIDSKYYRTKEAMMAEDPTLTEAGANKMSNFEERLFKYSMFLLM